MRKHISSKLNTVAHQLMNKTNLPWGTCFRLGIKLLNIPMHDLRVSTSITGTWREASTYALAGHFWGLHKAYEELGDTGRSYTMRRASKTLYSKVDTYYACSLKDLSMAQGLAEGVLKESVDFFVASQSKELTPRSKNLIALGAQHYQMYVEAPKWMF